MSVKGECEIEITQECIDKLAGMKMREFDTGATRDTDEGKYDYEGFLSPLVVERFGQYMTKHRKQADGNVRDSDNWQKGIPLDAYMKSGWRHFIDWWKEHRHHKTKEGVEEALCALMFNVMGYLHEYLQRDTRSSFSCAKEVADEEFDPSD